MIHQRLGLATTLLMAMIWSGTALAEPVPEDFVSGWVLDVPGEAPAYRVRLDARILETLAHPKGVDLAVLDADGRSVPAARLEAPHLTELRHRREPLEFRAERVAAGEPAPSDGTELVLDLDDSGTRLSFRTPGGESTDERDDRPGYRALVAAGPASGQEWQWQLALEFRSDRNRVADLDCRLNPADSDRPAQTRLRLEPLGDSRPYRYRASVPLGSPLPGGWQIQCFGEPPPGFELHAARREGIRRVVHEKRLTLSPRPRAVPGAPGAWRLDLGGPFRVTGVRLAVEQANLVSNVTWFSSSSPAGLRVARGTTVVSTLPGSVDAVGRIRPGEDIRDRHWYLETDPPVTEGLRVTVEAAAEEVLFLAQGTPPWMLVAGSARFEPASADPAWFEPALGRLGPA